MDSEPMNAPSVPEEAPVLINRCHFDEAALRKLYKQILKPMVVLQLVAAAVMLGLALYYTLSYARYLSDNASILVMVILLYAFSGFELWRALRSVDQTVTRTLRRTEERYGVREYELTLRFGEREVLVENSLSDKTDTLDYVDFGKLKRGEDLITFRTASRSVCTLDPARFENGTEADFWRLMNRKCPFAVPKDRRA